MLSPAAVGRLTLLAFVTPALLAAQARGRVVDDTGAPVAEASVEIWSGGARLAARRTDGDGRFAFDPASLGGARGALVRRIGFAPLRAPWTPPAPGLPDEGAPLVLARLAGMLPTITIAAAARLCPHADEPAARALWERTSRAYAAADGLALGTTYAYGDATVSAREVGPPDSSRRALFPVDGRRWVRGAVSRRYVERLGYAWPLRGTHGYREFGLWQYPPLHDDFAWQFADSLFGDRHTLHLVLAAGGATTLAFCPRDRARPALEGTLSLGGDGAPLVARWRVRNPARGAEDAGGEVAFAPANPEEAAGGRPVLLPAAGIFWRRLPSGAYYVQWEEFAAWTVRPWDAIPSR